MSSLPTELSEIATAENLLDSLRFKALTNPLGPAIDLIWDLPNPTGSPDDITMMVLRRERRFPGRGRRGNAPVDATPQDLIDGVLVFDSATFEYDIEEKWEEWEGDHLFSTTYQYLYRGTPRDRILVRSIQREYHQDQPDPLCTTIRIIDRLNLTPGKIFYYTAFIGAAHIYSQLTQDSALATERYNRSLFYELPQIHQRLDDQPPSAGSVVNADRDKGQLQRFTEIFDAHQDMFHGMIQGLLNLHNPREVDARLLPNLARQIGWRLKGYLNEDDQRNEITFAYQVYRTIGTIPNIAAIVNRLTGWDARVREYAKSILLSFDTKRIEFLEDGTAVYLDGSLQPHSPVPPYLAARSIPLGSVDTSDPVAMYKLRTRAFDDQTAYSYDCGERSGTGDYIRTNDTWYNRETAGIYIIPDVETEFFSLEEEWNRIRQILTEFLPIQVRVVFVLQPGVVVEEEYDATRDVSEAFIDLGLELKSELYEGATDISVDRIPAWLWFISNDLSHRSVDTGAVSIDTSSRTWHTGLDQGI